MNNLTILPLICPVFESKQKNPDNSVSETCIRLQRQSLTGIGQFCHLYPVSTSIANKRNFLSWRPVIEKGDHCCSHVLLP